MGNLPWKTRRHPLRSRELGFAGLRPCDAPGGWAATGLAVISQEC